MCFPRATNALKSISAHFSSFVFTLNAAVAAGEQLAAISHDATLLVVSLIEKSEKRSRSHCVLMCVCRL